MQVVLVIFRADGERRSVSIVHDTTLIGRGADCDLRIAMLEISRHHCRLIREGAALKVQDLDSSNGTFVNGQRIREAKLNAGDRIKVGPVSAVVQINGRPPDAEMEHGGHRVAPAKAHPGGGSGLEVDPSVDQPYDPMEDFAMDEKKVDDEEDEFDKLDLDFTDPPSPPEEDPTKSG